ncbi:HARBI1 [Mytilus edulis]|uniref:Putative nuclease HARBI1 n=1 Tax=Mytilus edulis TaxID=6550 RepID=A0A8S3SDT9_MYTED|nr:HARBI1 [Mytilus edulis]
MALMQLFHANNQNNLRRNRIFRDRLNPLDAYDDHELLYRYRMSRQTLMRVIDMVRDDIVHETQRSYALTPEQQTFAAIRYYATGSFQTVVGDIMGISQPSMSRIVQRVSSALCRHAGQYIRFPTTPRFQQAVKEGFMNEFTFPNVLGCVDGSLVQIKAPSTREDMYVCRKGYHALNIQGICDSQKKFLNLVVRWPGSSHDAFIWNESGVKRYMENHADCGYLLGDQAYPLQPYLLTPVRNPQSDGELAYNRLHQRTRQRVEDTFGRWKCRWLMLHKFGGAITIELKNAIKAIIATGVLHNICEEDGVPIPEDDVPPMGRNDNGDDVNVNDHDDNAGITVRARLIRERFE